MPLPPSKSGVSHSSSRMHSSIYGSAMAPKPAPSRPSTGGAFKAGGGARAFAAPVSNRTAAENRILRVGSGGSDWSQSPRETPTFGSNVVDVTALPPAGTRKPETDREQQVRPGRAPGLPLSADAANLLHDGSDSVPGTPSVFSARAKQMPMTPQYAPPSMQQSKLQQAHKQSQQSQQPWATSTMQSQQRWATSAQSQQRCAASAAYSQRSQPPHIASGDFTVTDLTDPEPVPDGRPSSAAAAPPPEPEPELEPEPEPPVAVPPPEPEPIDPADAALGAGVFAKVRMTHGRDGQIVAVKTYNHKEAREERAVAKHMANEERLAGKIQHEHIIAPQVARRGDGCTELEMEYAPGGTLDEFVKKIGRPLSEDEARRLFRQLVDAVCYLHADKGISHRDIKMENVVLDAEGNARLVDFGAAKEGGANNFLTSMQGTPAYMAPEIAQLRAHKGGPADVWALGVLLYNLVSGGAFPFWGRNMDELKRNITAAPPKLPAHLSPSCKDLLSKLLQKSSAIRLSSSDVRKHPWVQMPDPPGSMLPMRKQAADGSAAGGATAGGATAGGAAVAIGGGAQQHVNAAVAADAAAAANAYRGELQAARDAASKRMQQHGIQPPGTASPARGLGRGQQQPSPAQSPRSGNGGMYQNAYYQNYSRNPITGMATPGVDSRPSTAGGASPRSSKLAGLMNGSGRPGTACSQGLGRAASEAQLRAQAHRR